MFLLFAIALLSTLSNADEIEIFTGLPEDCEVIPESMNGISHPKGCPGAVWQSGNPSHHFCTNDDGDGRFPWWEQCCKWAKWGEYDHACKAKDYCEVLPESMNGLSHPKGCPGAVLSSGSPAKHFCNNDDGRFPWWERCCKWENNECKPKDTDVDCVLEADEWNTRRISDCTASCGTVTQDILTLALGSGSCNPETYKCQPGDGNCPECDCIGIRTNRHSSGFGEICKPHGETWDNDGNWCYLKGEMWAKNCPGAIKSSVVNSYWSKIPCTVGKNEEVECARVGRMCKCPKELGYVTFGAVGNFKKIYYENGGDFPCTVDYFGEDPAPGKIKKCFCAKRKRCTCSNGTPSTHKCEGEERCEACNDKFKIRDFPRVSEIDVGGPKCIKKSNHRCECDLSRSPLSMKNGYICTATGSIRKDSCKSGLCRRPGSINWEDRLDLCIQPTECTVKFHYWNLCDNSDSGYISKTFPVYTDNMKGRALVYTIRYQSPVGCNDAEPSNHKHVIASIVYNGEFAGSYSEDLVRNTNVAVFIDDVTFSENCPFEYMHMPEQYLPKTTRDSLAIEPLRERNSYKTKIEEVGNPIDSPPVAATYPPVAATYPPVTEWAPDPRGSASVANLPTPVFANPFATHSPIDTFNTNPPIAATNPIVATNPPVVATQPPVTAVAAVVSPPQKENLNSNAAEETEGSFYKIAFWILLAIAFLMCLAAVVYGCKTLDKSEEAELVAHQSTIPVSEVKSPGMEKIWSNSTGETPGTAMEPEIIPQSNPAQL